MPIFVPVTESPYPLAPTTDSQPVPCDYQGHAFWDDKSALCAALHLVFVKYAEEHRRISAYGVRQSITLFFDFAVVHNARNPEPLHLKYLTDISGEVFNQFDSFLRQINKPRDIAATLKSAIAYVAKRSDLIHDLMLPEMSRRTPKKPTEPIVGNTYLQLSDALKAHIDKLYAKLEFRKIVEDAKPYTMEEVLDEYCAPYSREYIFLWAQDRVDRKQKLTTRNVTFKLKHSTDPELRALAEDPNRLARFKDIFNNRPTCYHFAQARDPFDKSLWHWNPDDARALKTMLVNGYPMDVPLEALSSTYSSTYLLSRTDCVNIVQLMLFRWNRLGAKELIRHPVKPWDDMLELYFPSMMDMSVIIMFIMLQSNWNKETVLATDADNFEHPLTGAMSESQVIIQSEKNRAQGHGKPYYAPKTIPAISNKDDCYSSYNLIKLADALSEPLKGYAFDVIPLGQEHLIYSPLFLCLRFYGSWASKGGRHSSATNNKAFLRGVKDFFKRYPIIEKGAPLASAKEITKRLRPTWAMHKKKAVSAGLGLIAMQLSHADTIVTDVHYLNSSEAIAEREERLRSELEAITQLLLTGQYQGLVGKHIEQPIDLPMKIFHIPGQERPMWSCSNQLKPTWYGARSHVKQGERCYSIRHCMYCQQCNLYDDSLPYLMQRRIHVQELIEDRPQGESEYSDSLDTELGIIESILDNWEDPDALKAASRYQRRNAPLLPHDLDFLQLIFEEEDME
ncbi:hypothetical protein [Pseudomonas sp. SDO55104_S430]